MYYMYKINLSQIQREFMDLLILYLHYQVFRERSLQIKIKS